MSRVIDYWRGLVADVREAESSSAEHLRAIGDLWYPVLQMRVLAAVHDGAERKLGPCDLPADHAEQVARRVWADIVAAIHKRAVPEAWPDYAAVIAILIPWLAQRWGVDPARVPEALAERPVSELDDLVEDAFAALYPEPLPSRDEHVVRGAISAYVYRERSWPDLGTWAPFTLYSITARYFEHGHYLGPRLCTSESEILDLVELAPYGEEWARRVVRKRAQNRTVDSYLAVLDAILNRQTLPQSPNLVSRRLTLVEWLSDPEARLARIVEYHGRAVSDGVVWRTFRGADRETMLSVLHAATGECAYSPALSEAQRRSALERLVEAMEALALRTEMVMMSADCHGLPAARWAHAVVEARAPKASKNVQLSLLSAISARKPVPAALGPARRNRSLRSLYRTLEVASTPGAGITFDSLPEPDAQTES